jgi:hypothetical protein
MNSWQRGRRPLVLFRTANGDSRGPVLADVELNWYLPSL